MPSRDAMTHAAAMRAVGSPVPAGTLVAGTTLRRQLASDTLFNGLAEIEIRHGDMIYRLRQTALGKLILTK